MTHEQAKATLRIPAVRRIVENAARELAKIVQEMKGVDDGTT